MAIDYVIAYMFLAASLSLLTPSVRIGNKFVCL